MILVPSMIGSILPNLYNSSSGLINEEDEYNRNNLINPKLSAVRDAIWWDKTYSYRQIINVTNPYSVNLTDYAVNITFYHADLVDDLKLNSDLSDLRIVENGILRKYYFESDYPNINETTVWFDTNVSAGVNDDDTFLYYGKPTASIDDEGHYFMNTATNDPADSFGWIRNGDFELDNKSTAPNPKLIDGVFGWNWTDDVPDDMTGEPPAGYDPTLDDPVDVNYQHNISVTNTVHEILKGDYTFKWGVEEHEMTGATGLDFIGTLFSFPFIVPQIVGAGSPKIYLKFWRNIRVYDKSRNNFVQYFARISNGYSQTMASGHDMVGDYIEQWDSTGTNNNGLERFYNIPGDVEPFDTKVNTAFLTNDLNDDLYFDVTPYEGDLIFVEFGMFGLEGSAVSAFGQIDSVSFNYILPTELDPEVEQRKAEITIITRDVDGRTVPNAEVSLINSTGLLYEVLDTRYTSTDEGSAIFPSVTFGDYNFTVNYTLPEGKEIVVYNSSAIDGFPGYTINTSQHTFDLPLDMWTIDFEMVDYDKEMLNYGYILVNETPGVYLANLTLDEYGKATFRGENQSEYYYQLYYNNDDYNLNPTALNESYIYRSTYDQNNKYQAQTLYIKQLNLNATGELIFNVSQRVYTNGSLTELGNKKITHANINISLLDQGCDFTSVRIYYIDKDNSTDGNLIYENTSYIAADIEEIIDFDIRYPPIASANLPGDSYEVYGLLIELIGDNSSITVCNGVINVNFTETTNIYNTTDLVKLNVKIVDSYDVGVTACFVNVNSTEGRAAGFDVDLKTDSSGFSFGQGNTDIPFWFLRGVNYSFTLTFLGDHVDLNVTESDQWLGFVGYYYTYKLLSQTNVTLKLHFGVGVVINLSKYQTRFKDLDVVDQVMWGENVTVNVNFTKTDDDWVTENPVTAPTAINCTIRSTGIGSKTIFTLDMVPGVGAGIFTLTFNSTLLSAGTRGGEVYSIIVSGTKEGYINPSDVSDTIYVEAIPTILTMHDYNNLSAEINDISQTFGETINLTVKYYNISNSPLTDATLTYEWLSLDPVQFYEDPINLGYYTTILNTSLAGVYGLRSILFTATKENFTRQTFYTSISITERQTVLNGSNTVIYLSESVFALETETIEFNYTDVLSLTRISNPDEASYNWQKLDESGDPIAGENKIGSLNETADHRYILDLGTESMEIGEYFVFISFQKINYELKNVVITLTIEDRLTSVDGSVGPFIIDIGDISNFNFTFSYTDDLTNTSITNLDTQSYVYNGTLSNAGSLGYDSNSEEYYLNGSATADLVSGSYTFTFTLDKQNYTSQVVVVSLVITYISSDYKSFLTLISQNPSNFTTDIYWRDSITINFTFTTQYQTGSIDPDNPTSIYLQFLDESLNAIGSSINLINENSSQGIYSYTFNTSDFSLIGGESYSINIYASKTTPNVYTPPTPLPIPFRVQSVLTDLTIHNYTIGTEFPSYTLTEYWNQTLGITIYFKELISNAPLTSAVVTYSWAFGSGQINPDGTKGPGYYSFFFNTGNVTETGAYVINILAVKQNFTSGVPSPNLIISIINRPTLLNSNEDVLYLRQTFFELDTLNFTFEFYDVLTSYIIGAADEKSFVLHKREANGDPIPGSAITGSLYETADHRYILDADTETLSAGDYSLVITLRKDNYNFRVAIIALTVYKREFSFDFSTGTRINLASGGDVKFQITLIDLNNNSVPIIGADLTLTIKDIVYSTSTTGIIDNGDGTYTVDTLTIAEPFFTSETFIATLTIGKANFTAETREFTVVVQITEIFPGMPTFYFILITASVIGVLGSVTGYRVIQQARIPKHVKKIRKIKKLIKSKKSITEAISIPTKTEMMAKLFGDDWKEISLSIEETLGIEQAKKKLPIKGIKKDTEQKISKLKEQQEKAEAKSIKEKEKLAKKEAEAKAKKEKDEENARIKAEQKAKKEEERIAKEEAEAKTKKEKEEENARVKAEQEAKKEEERIAKEEAEVKAKKEMEEENARVKAEQEAKKEEERLAKDEAELKAREEEKLTDDEIPKDETKEERGENE